MSCKIFKLINIYPSYKHVYYILVTKRTWCLNSETLYM